MLTPEDEHALRDRWTIELLEATSPAWVLSRVRLDVRAGVPAYDRPPDAARPRPFQPRDLLIACASCGAAVHVRRTDSRYCSGRCRNRAHYARAKERAA